MEEEVSVRCLKRDVHLVKSVLRDAESEFKNECKK